MKKSMKSRNDKKKLRHKTKKNIKHNKHRIMIPSSMIISNE